MLYMLLLQIDLTCLFSLSLSLSLCVVLVRENTRRGVYVEGLTEETISSSSAATLLLARGYKNRHVAETLMNRSVQLQLNTTLRRIYICDAQFDWLHSFFTLSLTMSM